jgi:hypothetical protein
MKNSYKKLVLLITIYGKYRISTNKIVLFNVYNTQKYSTHNKNYQYYLDKGLLITIIELMNNNKGVRKITKYLNDK